MSAKILFIITALLVLQGFSSKIRIDSKTRNFIDQNNRVLLFHGVNAVYKLPPFYPPVLDKFDPNLSLSPQDFQNLRGWGFNVIRLHIAWEGVEPTRGHYNDTYILQVRQIVRTAAQYNITILLDAHQDLISRKFCGEGFPAWAVEHKNFPSPLKVNISFDSNGYANITQCLSIPFFKYYLTKDVQREWENYYTNVNGVRDSFTNMWQHVATFFKDEPNLIGYEVLNEPFSANLYEDPTSIIYARQDDIKFLQPLYLATHNKIRAVDNDTIIFFEPIVNDLTGVGLRQGPGGDAWNDKQALSHHVYCGIVDNNGEPDIAEVCHGIDSFTFKNHQNNAVKIGVPAFLTEFGAVSNSTRSAAEISYVTGLADDHLNSWAFWQFKGYNDITTAARPASIEGFYDEKGNLQSQKVKALSRNYVYATCGTPVKQAFHPKNAEFVFTYKPRTDCNGANTELYISEGFHYPRGFTYKFKGCDQCKLTSLGPKGYHQIVLSGKWQQEITLEVKANVSATTEIDI